MIPNFRKFANNFLQLLHPSAYWMRQSYSQEGEDLILDRILDSKRTGFYIDVGCHHPFRFSNSYLFYRRGWQGICVDPLPEAKSSFRRYRPRDTFVETAVA